MEAEKVAIGRIRELKQGRQHLYALCDWAVHTDEMTPDEIAGEVIRQRFDLAYRNGEVSIYRRRGGAYATASTDSP